MEAVGTREWIWIGTNVIVGVPLALAALVFVRECFRAVASVAFGFRVFEIHWGVGKRIAERQVGPVDLVLGRIPLAGATIARSGEPRRHRIARGALALVPALLQLSWLIARESGDLKLIESLSSGPAILAVFDIANRLLLALHLAIPIQLSPSVQTDIRLLIEALLGHAGSNRMARASYYARSARQRIERADVTGARQVLAHGLVQLGREPILVACDQCLLETDLSSVIDLGDCADALAALIERAETERDLERRTRSFRDGFRRACFMAAPMLVISTLLGVAHAERIVNSFESRWLLESDAAAVEGEPERCSSLIEYGATWAYRIDRWLPPEPSKRSDRHLAFARLERCRGDLAAADGHQGEALLAANAARSELAPVMFSEPDRWLENELRLTQLFRHAAVVEADRNAYRQALMAITNAEQRLEAMQRQILLWPEPAQRQRAEQTLAAERTELLAMRDRVMASLSAR